MKKIKLLTSLTSLGVLITTPTTVLSCSGEKEEDNYKIEADSTTAVNCSVTGNTLFTYSSQLEASITFKIKDKTDLIWTIEPVGSSTPFKLISIDDPSIGVLKVAKGFTGYFKINVIANDSNGKQVDKLEFNVSAEGFEPSYEVSVDAGHAWSWTNKYTLQMAYSTDEFLATVTCKTLNDIVISEITNFDGGAVPSFVTLTTRLSQIEFRISSAITTGTYNFIIYWSSPNGIVYHSVLILNIVN